MSNVTNKIGCESGRTKIVDPNDFSGFNSQSNMSVPLEDLNISVVLKTFRKGRTVLTSGDGKATSGTRESTETISINFIEGSTIGGKKALTTKYTDLTVLGSDSNNDEALGITNIDIDFNSSMAPMVNISFIDVRGSAIFQNEQNISGNNTANKYSTFFQLPYPKFELEVKGYYGKPVTYCLHMLKFNSKFNSQTGNFEITCQFIGYTYAMLSDMLIGYLKAIPFTKIGAEKYEKYNTERGYEVLTLVDLMRKISEINKGVEKVASTSENAITYENAQKALEDLNTIEALMNSLGLEIESGFNSNTKNKYPFIVRENKALRDQDETTIETYRTNVKDLIKSFNDKNAGATLDEGYFVFFDATNKNKGLYSGISKKMVNPSTTNEFDQDTLSKSLGSPPNLVERKKIIFDLLNKDYTVSDDIKLDIYNMNGLFDKINVARTSVGKKIKEAKEALANDLKKTVADTLGFEPTVRRIIEVFTVAIEVFMETIYAVSTAAEDKNNIARSAQLESKFGNEIINSDIKKANLEAKDFFAWPDYREKNEKTKTYVDKYLGELGVLDRPQDVNELVFIDDLLAAFIKAAKISDEAQQNMEEGVTTWFPINPLDSSHYNSTEPYERTELHSQADVARLMLIRGMTFLGYTNDEASLTDEEIVAMALAETDAILRGVKDDNVKQTLSLMTLNNVIDVKGTINGSSRNVIDLATTRYGAPTEAYYYYDYIYNYNSPRTFKVIPINEGFDNATWGDIDSGTVFSLINTDKNRKELVKQREGGKHFLTNYSSAFGSDKDNANNRFTKEDDGGMYVQILSVNEFETTKEFYASEVITPEIVALKLESLDTPTLNMNQAKEAGFNIIGGTQGIQEYSKMNFGGTIGENLPLFYVFYNDTGKYSLAFTRAISGEKLNLGQPTNSKYDYVENKVIPYSYTLDDYYLSKSLVNLHVGLNPSTDKYTTRELFNEYINNASQITYPYLLQPSSFTDQVGFSLFGSKWYYLQDKAQIHVGNDYVKCGKYTKAMLFLNILPFTTNGVDMDENAKEIDYIKHLFDIRGGFVHAPRLWCAYIGSLLWRMSYNKPEYEKDQDGNYIITGGGSGAQDPIYWKKNENDPWNYIPEKYQYFTTIGDYNDSGFINMTARDLMFRLPQQVKDEFKRVFFEFVNDGSWDTIRKGLEIWDGSSTDFCIMLNNAHFLSNTTNVNTTDKFNTYKLHQLINQDRYEMIIPISSESDEWAHNFLHLELKDGYGTNDSVTNLLKALSEEVVIANNSYAIWRGTIKEKGYISDDWLEDERAEVSASKKTFDLYFNTIINKLKATSDAYSPTNEKKKYEQQIFGTANEDTIKLQLYRTCKNIHDKWLAGTIDPNNIIFQCGSGNRSRVDTELAMHRGNTTKTRLIDSFRFISRSFKDIGDELYVNPIPVNDYLIDNPNTSSYDAISSLLANNNFDFIALPTFINFRDVAEVEAIFEPFPNYTKAISGGVCGPSFVCAYVGQKSQHLDYSNSDYPNDGFDLRCNGGDIDPNVPDDFKENSSTHEDAVGAFVVRYSQQNQNIFKDIDLDQSEFTETDESLQIQEDISQKGSETNRTIAGQNLYNVYAVRSYSAQVEMMGNAMIQPMMYFQLDNIPMFHGAYMITRVKHSIKPNNMSTNFTGVRIRYAETPLVDAMDLYMSFVDNLDTSNAPTGSGSGTVPKSASPLLQTLLDNGASSGNVNIGNIKLTKIEDNIPGIKFMLSPDSRMIDEAAVSAKEMLKDWAKWMADSGFQPLTKRGSEKIYGYVTSMFRTKGGNSMHCFGIAMDLQMPRKDGSLIPNKAPSGGRYSPPEYFNFEKNPALKWLYNHAYEYGFVQPYWANDGKGSGDDSEEHWHWEYHGKSAICMLKKRPIPGRGNNKASDNPVSEIKESKIKSFVKNPKGKDGKEASYSGCDYKTAIATDIANGIDSDVDNTVPTKAEVLETQIKAKNFFKAQGLTKSETAGIMGNIHHETGGTWNPNATNKKDRNGFSSYGLIQWNQQFRSKEEVGNTVDSQLKFITTMSTYKKWLGLDDSYGTKKYANSAAYEFARLVEVCHKCNEGYNEYKTSYQFTRSQFANDFFNRFNNANDKLAW